LKALLARAAQAGSFAETRARLAGSQMAVRAVFNRLLAVP
jgi:hypothetical protein